LLILLEASTLGQGPKPSGREQALLLGKEQPALSISINGPSDLVYSDGHIYLIETAGMGVLSLDVRGQTAALVLAPPADPYTKNDDVLGAPVALAVSGIGQIFVADVSGKLAQVNPATHLASIRRRGLLEKFPQVHAMTADPHSGTIILADRHTLLRRAPVANELTKVGGSYRRPGFSGDGGPAKDATFNWPQGLAVDTGGKILVADTENCRLRRIDVESGIITTIAGGIRCDSSGDGGPAKVALLSNPRAVATDSHGNIFLSEGCRVRRIDPDGIITTYAGTSKCGFNGDGGLSTNAAISADGLAVDEDGNLYIADFSNNRIRRVGAGNHRITTFAGNGLPKRIDAQM